MKNVEELLQERLERFEAGEPLENCLAGLSESENRALQLAASLLELQFPRRDQDMVISQRAQLIRASIRSRKMNNLSSNQPNNGRHMPRRNGLVLGLVAGALVIALFCLFAIITGVGATGLFAFLRSGQAAESGIVQSNSPEEVALNSPRGLVEVQTPDGTWARVGAGSAYRAGAHLRTGSFSSATLVFYDGSQATLEANSEIMLDAVSARTSGGPRIIRMTQWLGRTHHDVAKSTVEGSAYEVNTPSGAGVAKGTSFGVVVTNTQLTRFRVDEGEVEVTAQTSTVVLIAGQSTTILPGQAPANPTFIITGTGVVTASGGLWGLAGQSFITDSSTIVIGSPQVGDTVSFEGRTLSDGTRIVDVIILIHHAPQNEFSLQGTVDAMGGTWTVGGQSITTNADTTIDADIQTGDTVNVSGVILPNGVLLAESIGLVEKQEQTFAFTGVVEGMGNPWSISGASISVDNQTAVDPDIQIGDVVSVGGVIEDNSTWLARSIGKADDNNCEFHISGEVESVDPLVVSGVEVATGASTEMDDLKIGDHVIVEGCLQDDGTWLADQVEVDEDNAEEDFCFKFTGEVISVDPLVVEGIPVGLAGEITLPDGLTVGDTVKVKGCFVDGHLIATKIKIVHDDDNGDEDDFEWGCITTALLVQSTNGQQIVLSTGQAIQTSGISVQGNIQVASVVTMTVCTHKNGTFTVISIVVIYQLDALPTPAPGYGDHDDDDDEDDDD